MIKHLSVSKLNLHLLEVERSLIPLCSSAEDSIETTVQVSPEVQKRIDKLRTALLMLRREFNKYRAEQEQLTESEKVKIVQSILVDLQSKSKQTAFDFAVLSYDSLFFKSLTDYDLKVRIARQLLDYFGTAYEIDLWKNIADNNPAVYDILYKV